LGVTVGFGVLVGVKVIVGVIVGSNVIVFVAVVVGRMVAVGAGVFELQAFKSSPKTRIRLDVNLIFIRFSLF